MDECFIEIDSPINASMIMSVLCIRGHQRLVYHGNMKQ